MQANPDILQMKYARIVKLFAEQAGISYEKDDSNNNKKHTCKIIEYVPE